MVLLTLLTCSSLEENDAQDNAKEFRFSYNFSAKLEVPDAFLSLPLACVLSLLSPSASFCSFLICLAVGLIIKLLLKEHAPVRGTTSAHSSICKCRRFSVAKRRSLQGRSPTFSRCRSGSTISMNSPKCKMGQYTLSCC
jgi:hypothetical protein